jgi:hypothetical protein
MRRRFGCERELAEHPAALLDELAVRVERRLRGRIRRAPWKPWRDYSCPPGPLLLTAGPNTLTEPSEWSTSSKRFRPLLCFGIVEL